MIVDSAANAAMVSLELACALGGDMPTRNDDGSYTISVPDTGCMFRILLGGVLECDIPEASI